MKNTVILLSFALMGCSTTVPVVAKFPDVPPSLTQPCPPLKQIAGSSVNIVELHSTVVENYTEYYACAEKVQAWTEWHARQKKNFESVK